MQSNLNAAQQYKGRYDIMQNDKGQLLIIIDYHESAPYMPRLVHDGGTKALLYRNRDCAMTIDELQLEAAKALSAAEEVLITEIQEDDVAREYKVPVRHVKSLAALTK